MPPEAAGAGTPQGRPWGQGLAVLVATGVSNALVFVAYVAAGRVLGPSEYDVVAAMLGVVIVLTIPSLAMQTFVAREVAGALAAGRGLGAVASAHRRRLRQALLYGLVLSALMAGLAPVLSGPLGLGSVWPLLLTGLAALPILVMAEARGVQQGRQRFAGFGLNLVLEGVVRLGVTVAALALGLGATGVTASPVIGALVAAGAALWGMRDLRALTGEVPVVPQAAITLVFYAGFALVTNVDVVIANRVLGEAAAGEYGAATLFGRVVLLAPVAVGVVLVPLVVEAAAAGRRTARLLGLGLGAVAVTSGLAAAVGLLAPWLVRALTVGGDYADADPVIRVYGVAMAVFAALLVVALYDIALARPVTAWACLAAVPPQVATLLVADDRGVALAWVMLATGVVLLAVGLAEALWPRGLRASGAR